MQNIRAMIAKMDDDEFKKKSISGIASFGYKIFRFVLLFSLCFVILYPIIYMVSVAFRDPVDLYDPTVIWVPKTFTLDNFKLVIETLDYWNMLGSTLYYAIIGTLLNVISCALAGYGFARFNFKLKGILFTLMLFMLIVPSQLISIPLYLQYNNFDFFGISSLLKLITGNDFTVNLLDTSFSIFVPAAFGCGLRSGLLIYIFRQFFRGMPVALEDAAYIDGCGTVKTFLKIIIPNASGAFLVSTILSFVWYYNDYYFTSMFFSNPKTLSVAIAGLKDILAQAGFDTRSDPYSVVAQMQAGCLLVIIPLVLVFLFLQKYFIKSIASSGIVG